MIPRILKIMFLLAFFAFPLSLFGENTFHINLYKSTGEKDTTVKAVSCGNHFLFYKREAITKFNVSFYKNGKPTTFELQ